MRLASTTRSSALGAVFAFAFLRTIKFLKDYWPELYSNNDAGSVSAWITDTTCHDAVNRVLDRPNPELATAIEAECSKQPCEAIVKRLEFYSDGARVTELLSYFGINLRPLDPSSDVSYTVLPDMAYFEFIKVDHVTDAEGGGSRGRRDRPLLRDRCHHVYGPDTDKTREEDLLKAVTQAKLLLEPLGYLLTEYTSYADTSSIPGHYVLF
ncbi:Indole-3-acetic acid-amido synthetase GH3.17 [Canna indica]|uniref:Indole-3-acetic acid-amido synthetase GH3.17 n=1 Tax=Canna indica TaxID=4628 RepID=A0AAQ3KES0_9LILI|nr:Indole-3-acetic acid-amido synthetase GH3.17 [Canna indica]